MAFEEGGATSQRSPDIIQQAPKLGLWGDKEERAQHYLDGPASLILIWLFWKCTHTHTHRVHKWNTMHNVIYFTTSQLGSTNPDKPDYFKGQKTGWPSFTRCITDEARMSPHSRASFLVFFLWPSSLLLFSIVSPLQWPKTSSHSGCILRSENFGIGRNSHNHHLDRPCANL